MHILDIIQEARRNPELNPKTPINQVIIDRLENTTNDIAGTKNLFVSLTEVDKLGVNPRSTYNTPVGIYAYPAKYVVGVVGKHKPLNSLPFAGGSPYVNIFSVKGNIVNINNIDSRSVENYYKKIKRICIQHNIDVDEIDNLIIDSSTEARVDSDGGRLWYVTWQTADLLSAQPSWRTNKPSVAWTKLFKAIGIDGFVDIGDGIIHQNEPTQAVFFRLDAVVDNYRYYNKYSPNTTIQSRASGYRTRQEKHTIDQTLKDIVSADAGDGGKIERFVSKRDNFRLVKLSLIPRDILFDVLEKSPRLARARDLLPEYIQDFLVQKTPKNIEFILNPTEKIQKKVIADDVKNVQYINHPSLLVQQTVISQSPRNIRYIHNPSKGIQLMAVKADPVAVLYIDAPSEEVQVLAVKSNPNIIKELFASSEGAQLVAVKHDPRLIEYIHSPTRKVMDLAKILFNRLSEEQQLEFVQRKPINIRYLENPTEQMQLIAVNAWGGNIVDIKHPTPAVQLAAINSNPVNIRHIKNPAESVQLVAVNSMPSVIQYISKPTEPVQQAAISKDPNLLSHLINPAESTQLIAVKSNIDLLTHIANPTDKVKLFAQKMFDALDIDDQINLLGFNTGLLTKLPKIGEKVLLTLIERHASVYPYIPNPPLSVQKKAVEVDYYMISYIQDPSEELQLHAISAYAPAIALIRNPTERAQLAAINADHRLIKSISNPTPAVQLAAILKDPIALYYINRPNASVLSTAIKSNPKIIGKIDKPNEDLQIEAVTLDPSVFSLIKNPTPAVKKLFMKLTGASANYSK